MSSNLFRISIFNTITTMQIIEDIYDDDTPSLRCPRLVNLSSPMAVCVCFLSSHSYNIDYYDYSCT